MPQFLQGREWIAQVVTIAGATVAIITFLSDKIEDTMKEHMTKEHIGLYKPQFDGDNVNKQISELRKFVVDTVHQEMNSKYASVESLANKLDMLSNQLGEIKVQLAEVTTEVRLLREKPPQ